MSAGRRARRQLDRQLRREGKPRAVFRVVMMKDGRISETVAVDRQDARAVIASIEELLAQLKAKLQESALSRAPSAGPVPAAPQAAAAKYFGGKTE